MADARPLPRAWNLPLPGILEHRPRRLALWCVLAALSVLITFVAGPFIQFPIAFILPVAFAAWFDGVAQGLALAVALPVIRLTFVFGLWSVPWGEAYSVANAVIRVAVLGLLAVLTARAAEQQRALRREVGMLEKILPICSFCKRIREPDESWQPLETYFHAHADLAFSHGLCPECAAKHYPDVFEQSGP